MIIPPAALAALQNLKLTDREGRAIPGSENIGRNLAHIFKTIQKDTTTTEQQTNANPNGQPTPPPAINSLHVSTGPGGEFQAAITDNGQISRGVNYWLEHADNPHFTNPHVIDMGQSRNWAGHMGSQTLYWRAYSSYSGSPASDSVYHGSAATPKPVTGGVAGSRAAAQGSGTGAAGQGGVGPGPVPQRVPTAGFDWTAQQSK